MKKQKYKEPVRKYEIIISILMASAALIITYTAINYWL